MGTRTWTWSWTGTESAAQYLSACKAECFNSFVKSSKGSKRSGSGV